MTHGDFEEIPELPEGAKIISDYHIYMTPFKAVICPNGEVLFMRPGDLDQAFKDLETWALPIRDCVLNQ